MYDRVGYRYAVSNKQLQYDHAVATVMRLNGVVVSAGFLKPTFGRLSALMQVKTIAFALADRIAYHGLVGLMEINAEHIDAVVLDPCLQRIGVECGIIHQRRIVFLNISGVPGVLSALVQPVTYIDRIAEDMRLMNGQVEAVNAVATMDTRHSERIESCCTERVGQLGTLTVLHPTVFP